MSTPSSAREIAEQFAYHNDRCDPNESGSCCNQCGRAKLERAISALVAREVERERERISELLGSCSISNATLIYMRTAIRSLPPAPSGEAG